MTIIQWLLVDVLVTKTNTDKQAYKENVQGMNKYECINIRIITNEDVFLMLRGKRLFCKTETDSCQEELCINSHRQGN